MAITNNINQSASNLSKYTSTPSGNNSLGSDAFLKLLVAQLKHQDPLKPQSNTEFVAQLAQFSSLEQQTKTNSQLKSLVATQDKSAAFSLLGQEVVVATKNVYLQGKDIKLGFNTDQEAKNATINIVDSNGKTVNTLNMNRPEKGQNFLVWNGTDKSGVKLPGGTYKLKVTITDSAGKNLNNQPLVKVKVDEVALNKSGTTLVTGAGNIPLSGISSVVSQ